MHERRKGKRKVPLSVIPPTTYPGPALLSDAPRGISPSLTQHVTPSAVVRIHGKTAKRLQSEGHGILMLTGSDVRLPAERKRAGFAGEGIGKIDRYGCVLKKKKYPYILCAFYTCSHNIFLYSPSAPAEMLDE